MTDKGIRMKNPAHPGRFVRTIILEGHDLSVTEAAKALGVSRIALSRLVNEQSSLSADMAIRLDKAFGADMETLMRMQNSYDIALAKRNVAKIKIKPFRPNKSAA
jgi:addiction module HigA family antidote